MFWKIDGHGTYLFAGSKFISPMLEFLLERFIQWFQFFCFGLNQKSPLFILNLLQLTKSKINFQLNLKKNEFSMNFLINLILTWCLLHTFDSVLVSDVHVFAVDVIFRCPGVFLHSFWTRKYFNVNTSRSKIKNTSFIFSSSSLGSIFGFWIRIDCLNIDSRVFPKKRKNGSF